VKQACGLEKHGRNLIGALSRGYQQRLGIAQALLHDPPSSSLMNPQWHWIPSSYMKFAI